MPASMEMLNAKSGDVIARQGDAAEKFYVLQSGSVRAHLVPESQRNDDAAINQSDSVFTWDEQGLILGAESVVNGQYLESLVCQQDASLVIVPANGDGLRKVLLSNAKTGLGFLRMLARRVIQSNDSMTAAQTASQRLSSELESYYRDFYRIVTEIEKDADGEREIIAVLSDAKVSKTFSMGQGLSGAKDEERLEINRVVEEYEMTGNQHKLKRGDALFREGDDGGAMFMVVKGKLESFVEGQKAADIMEGDTVGEISVLLPGQKRTAEVIATENTTVAIVLGAQLEMLCGAQPAIMLQIARSLTRKLQANFDTVAKSRDKSRTSVTRYLAKEGVNPEKDYKELAKKIDELIEELDLTELLRPYDQLERGAEKIAAAKERYVEWIEASRA